MTSASVVSDSNLDVRFDGGKKIPCTFTINFDCSMNEHGTGQHSCGEAINRVWYDLAQMDLSTSVNCVNKFVIEESIGKLQWAATRAVPMTLMVRTPHQHKLAKRADPTTNLAASA